MKRLILALVASISVIGAASASYGTNDNMPQLTSVGDQVITVTNDALYDASTFAPSKRQDRVAQTIAPPSNTTKATTTVVSPTEPASVSTTVHGGGILADVLEWFKLALGTVAVAAFVGLISKIMSYFGVQTTQVQRDQLQSIAVNGLNQAAAKFETDLRSTTALDVDLKSKIVADAVQYTLDHAPETIKALGLDPKSGDAVRVIQARIETALNDPATPTPAAITPDQGKPPTVVVHT